MGYGLPEWLGETPLPEWVSPEQALRLQDRREAVLVDCRDPTGMGNGPGHADGCPEGAVNLSATATIMFPQQVRWRCTHDDLGSQPHGSPRGALVSASRNECVGAAKCALRVSNSSAAQVDIGSGYA